ncbi:MAG: hypothetical protein MUE84_07315, partial [Hyphomonas sp.]|nr:hypothetical protein [Hyphomonas sp.]
MPPDINQQATRLPNPRSEAFTSDLRQRLVAAGRLDELAARRAERACEQSNERLDIVLARLGLVSETVLCEAMADILNIPRVEDDAWPVQPIHSDIIPHTFLAANHMVLLSEADGLVNVAVADPFR